MGHTVRGPGDQSLPIGVCLLVCETDIDLMMASIKHCWEPSSRTLHHQQDNSPTTHIISYLNELAVCLPTNEAWDELVQPSTAVIPQVPTEAKSYRYCQGQAVDLDASSTILGNQQMRDLPVHH